jgi:hypothetical protein
LNSKADIDSETRPHRSDSLENQKYFKNVLNGKQLEYLRTQRNGELLAFTPRTAGPIPVQVPLVKTFYILQEEADMSIAGFINKHPYKPRAKKGNIVDAEYVFVDEKESAPQADKKSTDTPSQQASSDSVLIDHVKQFCMSILLNLFLSAKEHITSLKWSTSKFAKVKEYGLLNEYFEVHEIPTYRRGGIITTFLLKDKGYSLINSNPVEVRGHGSVVHKYYQHRCSQYYAAKGYITKVEHTVGEKSVDVYLEKPPDERIAAEIVISDELGKEVSNYTKDSMTGFSSIYFYAKDDKIKEKLSSLLSQNKTFSAYKIMFLAELL